MVEREEEMEKIELEKRMQEEEEQIMKKRMER